MRPVRYNEELAGQIAATMSSTSTRLAELCEQHEHWPTKATIMEWLRKHQDFFMRMVQALAIREGGFVV